MTTALLPEGLTYAPASEPNSARQPLVALYDALFRAQPDLTEGYLVLEAGRVVHVSLALVRVLGLDSSRTPSLAELAERIAPEARRSVLAAYRARLRGIAVTDRCESVLLGADDSRIDVEITARTLDIGAGRRQTLVLLRDITERKRSEAARAAALAENARLLIELRQAAHQQQVFLRDMLRIVTEGRLRLCDSAADLPQPPAGAAADASGPIDLTSESLSCVRRAVENAGMLAGLPPMRIYDLMMAVGEAAMNAVVHAKGGTALVFGSPAEGVVQVWVHDVGEGIALSHLHRATLEPGFTTAGTLGQGFALALRTADRLYLLTGPEGTTVVLEQHRNPPPEWTSSFGFSGTQAPFAV